MLREMTGESTVAHGCSDHSVRTGQLFRPCDATISARHGVPNAAAMSGEIGDRRGLRHIFAQTSPIGKPSGELSGASVISPE